MLLEGNKKLLQKFSGQVEKTLEEIISKMSGNYLIDKKNSVFGHVLSLDCILVNEETAANIVFTNARKQWGSVDFFTLGCLHALHIDTDSITERLTNFFYSPKSKKTMMDHLILHHQFTFGHLISLLYGKEAKGLQDVMELQTIYLYKVGNRYLVQPIFEEHKIFWEWLFAKKIYSLFMQMPLESIGNTQKLCIHIENVIQKTYTHVDKSSGDLIQSLDYLVENVDKSNQNSVEKKALFLQQLVTYFKLFNDQSEKLEQLAHELLRRWSTGFCRLTEKEKVLISYIQFVVANKQQHTNKVIKHGRYLLEHERINNYAVEIMLEYTNILPSVKPSPEVLVKQYSLNYLEYLLFGLIDALVKEERYEEAFKYVCEFQLASCEVIQHYLNANYDEDTLYRVEATVQQDIAYIVDNSLQYIGASIETWRESYQQVESMYYQIAEMTSKHICNLLKIFFVMERFDLFERLMETYKKYLKIDTHFEEMRQFMEKFIK